MINHLLIDVIVSMILNYHNNESNRVNTRQGAEDGVYRTNKEKARKNSSKGAPNTK